MTSFRQALRTLCAVLLAIAGCLAATANAQSPDFTRLMREGGRAVVNISGTYDAGEFEEETPEDLADEPGPPELDLRSLGTGFVVSEDGYIVTNAHVVSGSRRDDIVVRLADRREFRARLVGADRTTDIALLQIDARGLPRVRIGDPGRLQPGQWVAAIGSPLGLEQSITAGIVSAVGRVLPEEGYVPFIQTDVAVNPGNSGGPLFNLAGEVIGVNSIIYSGSGGYMGLSFAVPIDVAMEVVDQLRQHGRVRRARLGLRVQEVTAELAAALHLPRTAGALIADVDPAGPAGRAGMRPGDVIVEFDRHAVERYADLWRIAVRARPGTIAEIALIRRSAPLRLRMTIEEAPAERDRPMPEPPVATDRYGLGLSVLTDEQLFRLELEGGLLVREVSGAAQRAGLRRGDIIASVNGETVTTVTKFGMLMAQAPAGSSVAVLVQRGGLRLFVPLRVPG